MPVNSMKDNSSQEYDSFELDDPELLQFLDDAEVNSRKRPRSVSPDILEPAAQRLPTHPSAAGQAYLDAETYGASRFGELGQYMRRKRAKLQIQNAHIDERDDEEGGVVERSRIFQGLAIYVCVDIRRRAHES